MDLYGFDVISRQAGVSSSNYDVTPDGQARPDACLHHVSGMALRIVSSSQRWFM